MNHRALLLSTLATTFTATALLAQDATQPRVLLDQVNLEAQEAGAEGPAGAGPVTLIGADAIGQSQPTSLADVLRDVPGVNSTNRGNLLTSSPNLRGFGGAPHMNSDPSTRVLLDGVGTDGGRVYQNSNTMIVDPALMKSVGVAMGPLASLEHGSGIVGGTVRVDTINGADLTGDQVGMRFRQMLGANSNGDGWVTSSTLAWQPSRAVDFLFNYTRRALGNDQKDGAGKEVGLDGYNVPSLLLKARVKVDDDNTLTFSWNRSSSAERDVPYAQMTDSPLFGNVNRDRKGTVGAITWNYKPQGSNLIDLELRASRSKQDIDITALNPRNATTAMFAGRYNLVTDQVTLKNTARFNTGSVGHVLRAGLDWQRQERDNANYTPAGKLRRTGVFAIDEMDFGNELKASLGARFEHQSIDGWTKAARGQTQPTRYGKYDTDARTLGLGLEQGFGGGFTAYGSFTYGEGLPTLDVFTTRSATRGSYYGQDVQQSRTWEGGLRYQGADVFSAGDSLSASIGAYRTDIWNALYGPSSSTTAEYVAYSMRGIEAQARYSMASGFYARGGVSLTDHKERYHAAATGTVWRDYLYLPGNQLSFTLGQKFDNGVDLSWNMLANEKVTINDKRHAGWGVNDLRVSYSPTSGILEGTTLNFAIENIFDKTYQNSMSYLKEPGRNISFTIARTF